MKRCDGRRFFEKDVRKDHHDIINQLIYQLRGNFVRRKNVLKFFQQLVTTDLLATDKSIFRLFHFDDKIQMALFFNFIILRVFYKYTIFYNYELTNLI